MLRFNEYGALPEFANSENKQLDLQVRTKEKRLSQILVDLEDQASRADALSLHMKNVRQQLAQCQTLYEGKIREKQTEEHLKELSERECGRLSQDIKNFQKEAIELMSQSTATQNSIYRVSEKIAKLKTTLKCDTKETEDWLKVQQEKEEDNLILLKYTKEDDQKIRDLAFQIEKLMKQVHQKKAQLSHDLTEAQVSRMEVVRATDEFRKLHDERKELLKQWEQTILSAQNKDKELAKQQEQYQNLRIEVISKRKLIEEKQNLTDQETEKKKETEKNINVLDRQIGKLRMEYVESVEQLTSFQDELNTMKTHLARTSNDVVSKQQELHHLKEDVVEKKKQVKEENERYLGLQTTIKCMLRDTSSKEEKAEVLQTYLRQQESKNKELEKKTKYLKEREFKYTQELFKYRQDEKTLSSEISGAHAAIRNLTSKVNQLDQASIQQRTLLYHQEYTLQQVERKLKRAQGERTDEEKEQLNAKIQMLNAQYEQAQQTYHLLHTQLKKSQDDLRHSKRKYEVLEKEKGSLDEQLDELQLYSTSAQHQLQSKIKEKEELMVEESVLKLELNKLRGFLNARADEVLGLEARQVQLRLALEERSKEIEIHQSMLKGQLRACEEEKSEYTQEVKEKMAQVERKKTRFDIWMSQLGTTDDPIEEEERTQAFYIIKAAQQREDLQRQGDQLDLAIQKAEKEIKAMENTLIVLNHRNENFKVNLNQSDVLPEDIEHQQSLQLQFQTAQDKLTQKQQALEKQQREFMELETQLTQLNEIENQQQQTVTQLEQQSHLYVKQIQDQQSKKKRMEQTVSRLVKEYRKMKSGSVHDLTLEEEDIQQKQAKEMLRFIMYRVEEILSRKASTEVMDKLHQFYLNVGLQPPSRPMTQLSHLSDTSSFHASSKPSKGNHASRTSSRASSNQLENLTQGNPSPNAFKSTSVNNNNPWTATSLKPRSDTSVGPHMATFQFNLTPKSTSNSETSSLQARKHALSKMTLPSTGSMNKHALGIEICSPAKALPSLPGPSPAAPHKPSSYHPTFLRQGSARTPHQ